MLMNPVTTTPETLLAWLCTHHPLHVGYKFGEGVTSKSETEWYAAGGERERDMQLSDLERERLEDMLRQLKVERANIQAAMVFALDHASCAAEISDCLIASLTLSETPLHLKMARLYLASDVLHNSTVPVRNASRYRQLLQAELPSVFQSFHEALLSAEAALKREAFKRNSLRVLRVWRDWYLFSEDYLNGLQATFLMDTDVKWRGLCTDQLKV